MRALVTLLITGLVSVWLVVTATLTAQNESLLAIQFLGASTIRMPTGLALTSVFGVGLIGTAVLQMLWGRTR
jgi:uncharacterized membrane protein YciS (DUF1049 family)